MLRPRHWLTAIVLVIGAVRIAPAEDDVIVDGPIISLDPRLQGIMRIGVGSFDQLVFQHDGGAEHIEERLLTRAELQLADLDQACQLTVEQKQKLQLAAQGDIQRIFSEAAPLRVKFNSLVKGTTLEGPDAMEVYQRLNQELQPLRTRIQAGATDAPDSLFMKVISRTLTTEQQAKYAAINDDRRRVRYEANIAVYLLNLEEVVYLSESQRAEITRQLLAMPLPRNIGQYETYIIMGRMASIPAEKLEPHFSARQWRAFSAYLDQYRMTAKSLVESGYLEAEDIAPQPVVEKP